MGIHLPMVSSFARLTGKKRHFRDLTQQVLSRDVGFSQLYSPRSHPSKTLRWVLHIYRVGKMRRIVLLCKNQAFKIFF